MGEGEFSKSGRAVGAEFLGEEGKVDSVLEAGGESLEKEEKTHSSLNGSDERKTFSRLQRLGETVRELLDLTDDLVSSFHVVVRDPDLDDVQNPDKSHEIERSAESLFERKRRDETKLTSVESVAASL